MLFSRLQPKSIRTKLALTIFAGVTAAILLSAVFSGWRAAERRFDGLEQELSGVAATLAIAVAPAQAERDFPRVQHVLHAIGRIPRVRYAQVLDTKGKLIAAFGNGVVLERDVGVLEAVHRPGLIELLRVRTFPVDTPVISGGREIGRLYLIGDARELRGVLIESMASALLSGLIAALIGSLIALRVGRALTAPILSLTAAMRDVRERHDYGATVSRTSNDETGDLVDAFNDMLREIRQRDDALARHRETLEETVEERTRDLRQATAAAEQANAAKSDFLATMSHEIRTPMNGLLVMAELLNASGLPPRLQRYADVIVTSGRSLLSIINDILDFSKIEAGRMDLEAVPVDPRKLVDEVTRLFAERAASKGLDLAGYVGHDVPRLIVGDPVRLNQVLANLVNNALKFTETGGVTIRLTRVDGIGTMPSAADGAAATRLRFEVVDTGIGIPADKVDAIFDAFSQADQSTTRKFGGTGIGLAICRRLAEAMDGRIGVTSRFGSGSTFALEAAFVVGDEPARSVRPRPAPRRAILIDLERGPTRDSLAAYVKDAGYGVAILDGDVLAMPAGGPGEITVAVSRSCESLGRIGEAFTGVELVHLAGLGEIRWGSADATLTWPLSNAELAEFFAALDAGDLSALTQDENETLSTGAFRRFDKVRVLAADDSAINREVLAEALSRLGVEVESVENGRAAISAVIAGGAQYDLVFMDGSMPEIDGFDATRRIRAWERDTRRGTRLPIVALTAHVIGAQANLWRESGMDDCVTKPFTIAALEKCLAAWLPERVIDAAATPSTRQATGDGRAGDPGAAAADPEDHISEAAARLIDPDILDQIREMQSADFDLTARVVALYRVHAPQALGVLRATWADAADIDVARAAHALKSLSRNIGAVRVADLCDDIETEARESRLERDADRIPALEAALAATLDALPPTTAEEAAAAA